MYSYRGPAGHNARKKGARRPSVVAVRIAGSRALNSWRTIPNISLCWRWTLTPVTVHRLLTGIETSSRWRSTDTMQYNPCYQHLSTNLLIQSALSAFNSFVWNRRQLSWNYTAHKGIITVTKLLKFNGQLSLVTCSVIYIDMMSHPSVIDRFWARGTQLLTLAFTLTCDKFGNVDGPAKERIVIVL